MTVEVGGLAVLKIGGVTITVFPGEDGKDRMAIILAPGEEVGFDILAPNGHRFGQVEMESDDRLISGMLTITTSANADEQHISTDTPWPENQSTTTVIRGLEPRPSQPESKVREVLHAR